MAKDEVNDSIQTHIGLELLEHCPGVLLWMPVLVSVAL
jgi:hypothetical protein